MALGRTDDARAVLENVEPVVRDQPLRRLARLRALRVAGLLAAGDGDVAGARAAFEEALRLHLEVDFPLDRARAELDYGAVLRRDHRRAEARRLLERAVATLESRGAAALAGRARRELDRLGGRRPEVGLTAVERDIARLVASGRSNAEVANALFVSPKTVEWNLTKVYRKLRVRSRAELAAKLARDRGGAAASPGKPPATAL